MSFLKKLFNSKLKNDKIAEEKKIIEVNENTDVYNLVKSKMNDLDYQSINKKLENIEKVSQYILIKLQLILENQKTINEIIVNQATMIEELYNALNGPVNVSSSEKSEDKETKENNIQYIEYAKPKKENMN
jgi:hypothetical protein